MAAPSGGRSSFPNAGAKPAGGERHEPDAFGKPLEQLGGCGTAAGWWSQAHESPPIRPLSRGLAGAGRPLATEPLVRAVDRGLLRGDAAVGDVRGAVEDSPLVSPDQACAAAAVDGDGNGVGEVAVAVVEGAEDAVCADASDVHDGA